MCQNSRRSELLVLLVVLDDDDSLGALSIFNRVYFSINAQLVTDGDYAYNGVVYNSLIYTKIL